MYIYIYIYGGVLQKAISLIRHEYPWERVWFTWASISLHARCLCVTKLFFHWYYLCAKILNLLQAHILFTELTRVLCKLLSKDFCKVCLRKFTAIGSYMTIKSGFEQTIPSIDTTNIQVSVNSCFRSVQFILQCLILHVSDALQLVDIVLFSETSWQIHLPRK